MRCPLRPSRWPTKCASSARSRSSGPLEPRSHPLLAQEIRRAHAKALSCRSRSAPRAAGLPRSPNGTRDRRPRCARRAVRPDFQQRAAQLFIIRVAECSGEAKGKSRKMPGGGPLVPGADGLYKRHASAGASANPRHPPLSSGRLALIASYDGQPHQEQLGEDDLTDVPMVSLDSFKCRSTLSSGGKTYVYYSLPDAEKNGLEGISRLPFSHEGAAREPAALRGRPHRHRRRHRGGRRLARRQGHRGQARSPSGPRAC